MLFRNHTLVIQILVRFRNTGTIVLLVLVLVLVLDLVLGIWRLLRHPKRRREIFG